MPAALENHYLEKEMILGRPCGSDAGNIGGLRQRIILVMPAALENHWPKTRAMILGRSFTRAPASHGYRTKSASTTPKQIVN